MTISAFKSESKKRISLSSYEEPRAARKLLSCEDDGANVDRVVVV